MPAYRLLVDETATQEGNSHRFQDISTELDVCDSALDFVASLLSLPVSGATLQVSESALDFVEAVLNLPVLAVLAPEPPSPQF